jgi:hypothetical protein
LSRAATTAQRAASLSDFPLRGLALAFALAGFSHDANLVRPPARRTPILAVKLK